LAPGSEYTIWEDIDFLTRINIYSLIDPDEIVVIALADPALRRLALSGWLQKPSLETQQKLLSLLDDPNMATRSGTLMQFARWYGESDMVYKSAERWTPEAGCVTIPGEQDLRAYWYKKLGVTIKP